MVLALPLPAAELPEKIRKFGDPDAPEAARAMAARGLVPVKGDELVTLLVQLAADRSEKIGPAARETLTKLPDGVLAAACKSALHPAILDGLVDHVRSQPELLGELAGNRALDSETMARIARSADEQLCERIAVDQERLLAAPAIIEAL